MSEHIAYDKGGGDGYVDVEVARWVVAILEITERRSPGFREEVLTWLEQARPRPVSPEVLLGLKIAAKGEEMSCDHES